MKSQDTKSRGAVELAQACIDTAEQLLAVLGREAEILKSFSAKDLLEVLPKKEFLTGDLARGVKAYGELKERGEGLADTDPMRLRLRACLEAVGRQNETNRLFIESSLSFWGDLLEIFFPPSYGPGQMGAHGQIGAKSKQRPYPQKGLSFSMEA